MAIADDEAIYRAVADLLVATEAFDSVQYGVPIEDIWAGSDHQRVATVTPVSFQKIDAWDDIQYQRVVTGQVTVAVRCDDPADRLAALNLLIGAVEAALDQSDPAGLCLPAFSWVMQGQYRPATPPEQSVDLRVEFRTLEVAEDVPLSLDPLMDEPP
jgi:hypothetical protein